MLKKILVCILICLIINNFLISNISFASSNPITDLLAGLLGTVVGILTWPIRLVALAIGMVVDILTSQVAYSQGTIDAAGNIVPDSFFGEPRISPFDILFNKIAIININFFNIPDDGTVISNMRMAIASWYNVMRNIASAILLCVFIYVGIRMAITTVASDKAVYKKMLVDWVCSLALIYLLQYIIIFTFSVNEALVGALASVGEQGELTDIISTIATMSLGASTDAIAATVVYCMIVAQTLGLFISYFNRMLKIAFLIIIAPLITLTYSIDKMGDGKAQALGTWLKEFVYTVLIQPFHCIVYLVFISMSLEILSASPNNTLAGGVLAILCIKFTKDAEKLLGKIFKFGEHASDASLAVGMAASAVALSKAKSIGKGTRTFVNGIKNSRGTLRKIARNAKVDLKAGANFVLGHGTMSLAQAKDKAEAEVVKKEADKIANKNQKKYGVSESETFTAAEIGEFETADKDEIERWKTSNPTKYNKYQNYQYQKRVEAATAANKQAGMSDNVAKAHARVQIAREVRAEKEEDKSRNKVIRGAVSRLKQYSRNSETLKLLGDLGKATIATGMGTFAGSALYGSGKDLFTSFATGAAVYKGTTEFMKNSTTTLSNNISQLLEGAGITSTAGASMHLHTIAANGEKYEDIKKSIDDLFKDIDSALSNLSSNDKNNLKNAMRMAIQKEIQKSPTASTSTILNNVFSKSSIEGLMKAGRVNRGDIEGTVRKAANFCRDASIYQTMKQAGDIGISPDAFMESSIETFRNDLYGSIEYRTNPDDYPQNTTIVTEIKNSGRVLKDSDINSMEQEQLEDLIEKLKTEVGAGGSDEIKKAYEKAYKEAVEREVREIGNERAKDDEIVKRKLNATLDEIKAKMIELGKSATDDASVKSELRDRMEKVGIEDDKINKLLDLL